MFSSVSSCVPNSQVRLNFVSSKAQNLDIISSVNLYINGVLTLARPVNLAVGDSVEIRLTTPPNYLGRAFYSYILDDLQHAFAVVNTNDYRPVVKANDAPKRWFNYFPRDIRTSFYDDGETISRPLGRGHNYVDIDVTHVVLDHIQDRVNFYSTKRELVTTVYLPASPVEYKKSTYIDANNDIRVEVFVICSDKKLYNIRFDNRYSNSGIFNPTVRSVRGLEQIWFEADLPTGQSFVSNRQLFLRSKTNPAMTTLDIVGNAIWVAGYDTVAILDKQFTVSQTITIPNETIISLTCLDGLNAYAVTREGKIYHVTAGGSYAMIYNAASPLGTPATLQLAGQAPFILVPDPNNQRLLKIVGPTAPVLSDSWPTPGYAPAYARVFDNKLVVTSHDSNVVLVYADQSNRRDYSFSEKVTVASWVQDKTDPTLLAVHYLRNYVTLDLLGIEKIIPFKFESLKGPITQIGSEPYKIQMLGQESIPAYPGPGLTCWTNGIKDELANSDDNFGVSFKAAEIGKFRTAFIIGETAFDVDVEVVDDSAATFTTSYTPIVGLNKIPSLVTANVISMPSLGNIQSGTTTINLGFNLNFFGNIYSNINVSTNGYITFGNSFPTSISSNIGDLNVDALYVEPKDLYQGLPITNVNPAAVTFNPLPSGQTPAVYYETGKSSGFDYAKIRWVGTKGYPNPAGNTVVAPVTLVNSFDIPVDVADLTKASTNDYVASSTGSITVPTQVVSTYSTPTFNFNIYKILPGNIALVTYITPGLAAVALNSKLLGYSNYVVAKSNLLRQSTAIRGNYLLQIYNNVLVMDDGIDPAVTNDWSIRIPRAVIGVGPPYFYQTGITNIVSTTTTIPYIAPNDPTVVSGNRKITIPAANYNDILVYQKVISPNVVLGTVVVNKNIIGNDYVIELSSGHSLFVGNTISVTNTTITTSGNMPTLASGVLLQYAVDFEYAAFTFDNSQGVALGNISVKGAFITVSNAISTAAGSIINFKSNDPVEEYNYEVAFYQNNKFQFIEYFYDNTFHSLSTNIGMSTGTRVVGNKLLSNNVPASSSIVYGSATGTGFFKSIGIGSFNFSSSFIPMAPKFSQSPASSDYEYSVEFYIEQEIQPTSNIYLSASYGSLRVNGGFYNAYRPIKKNDLVQLTTPFNRSLRSIAPVISISDTQFPVPMIANAANSLLTKHEFVFNNQPVGTLVSVSITVPASDYYYIPDLYRTTGGIVDDYFYKVDRSGNISLQRDNTYDLFAGETLYVDGILTSAIQYDTRDVVLIGQNNAIIIRTSTAGPGLVDTLNFSTLIEPDTVNYNYNIVSTGPTPYVEYTTAYQTANLQLTSNAGITTANLFIGDAGTRFVINGNLQGSANLQLNLGGYVTNVPIGSNIAIHRDLIDYFQSNVVIYQVIKDLAASSNVFIPVGTWNIQNKIITSGTHTASTLLSVEKVDSLLDNPKVLKTDRIIDPQFFESLSTSVGAVTSQFEENNGVYSKISAAPLKLNNASFSRASVTPLYYRVASYLKYTISTALQKQSSSYVKSRIAASFIKVSSYIKFSVEREFYKVNDVSIGSVSSAAEPAYTYKLISSITNQYRDQGSFINSNISARSLKKETLIKVVSITPEKLANYSLFKSSILGRKISDPRYLLIDSIVGDQINPFNYLFGQNDTSKLSDQSILTSSILPNFEIKFTFIDTNEMTYISEDSTAYLLNETLGDNIKPFNYLINRTDADIEISSINHPYQFDADILVKETQTAGRQTPLFEISSENYFSVQTPTSYKQIQEMWFKMVKRRARIATEISNFVETRKISTASELPLNYVEVQQDRSGTELILNHLTTRSEPDTEMYSSHEARIPVAPSEGYFDQSEFSLYQLSWGFSPTYEFELGSYSIGSWISGEYEIEQATNMFGINYSIFGDYSTELLTPLIPLARNFTQMDIPFLPLQDLPPLYLLPFMPILNTPLEIYVPLPIMLDIVPELLITFDMYLYQEIAWKMDNMLLEVGAVKSHIHYWIDQTLYDSKWNLHRLPVNVDYNVFVEYTKDYVYKPGGFVSADAAEDEMVKYYNAGILQIPGTDFWNYRIYFKNRHFCVPKKGRIFPMTWYLRGG